MFLCESARETTHHKLDLRRAGDGDLQTGEFGQVEWCEVVIVSGDHLIPDKVVVSSNGGNNVSHVEIEIQEASISL